MYAFEVQSCSVKLQYQLIYLRNIIYPIERAINIKTDKRKAMFLPIWRCIKENKLFKEQVKKNIRDCDILFESTHHKKSETKLVFVVMTNQMEQNYNTFKT